MNPKVKLVSNLQTLHLYVTAIISRLEYQQKEELLINTSVNISTQLKKNVLL